MTKHVTIETADSYLVRNQGEWARIFLQEGLRESGERWGYISVISGYGNFGHCFSNIGRRSLRNFLLGVGFDYLMGKFLGFELNQFDAEATLKFMREHIIEQRRRKDIDAELAREAWEALAAVEEDSCASSDSFLVSLSHLCPKAFSELELWSYGRTRLNPQALGFWEEIWPVFCAQLRAEIGKTAAAA